MEVKLIKLKCGDLLIARVIQEDEHNIVIEKPYVIHYGFDGRDGRWKTLMLPWLFDLEDSNSPHRDTFSLSTSDVLFTRHVRKEVEQSYLSRSSGLHAPGTGQPPNRGGGVPPTRGGGGTPPTRGGFGPVQ